jgi:hypothetical protein
VAVELILPEALLDLLNGVVLISDGSLHGGFIWEIGFWHGAGDGAVETFLLTGPGFSEDGDWGNAGSSSNSPET